MKSAVCSSAQCRSSNTSTVGPSEPTTSASARNTRCRSAARSPSGTGAGGSRSASSGSSGRNAPTTGDQSAPVDAPPRPRTASITGPSGNDSRIRWHRPTSSRRPATSGRTSNSFTSRVLPMPASPSTTTTAGGAATACAMRSNSAARPTSVGETTRRSAASGGAMLAGPPRIIGPDSLDDHRAIVPALPALRSPLAGSDETRMRANH
jgi:hypothetical protein